MIIEDSTLCVLAFAQNQTPPDRYLQLLNTPVPGRPLSRHPKRYYRTSTSVSKSGKLPESQHRAEKPKLPASSDRTPSIHRKTVVPASASGRTSDAAQATATIVTATAAVAVLCAPSRAERLFFASIGFGFKFMILQVFDDDNDPG
jgi:hypothetical protein